MVKKMLSLFSGYLPFAVLFIGPSGTACFAQDTITVFANNPPVWGADLKVLVESKVGCLTGPDECVFGDITWVSVGMDGSVWVGDRFGPTIKRFATDGAYLGSVGRGGEGPGEYRRIGGMTTLPSGDVAVWDHPNQRITVFDSSGKYLQSFRATSRRPSAPLLSDVAGFLYLEAPAMEGGDRLGVESPQVWIKYDPTGMVIDSLPISLGHNEGPSFSQVTSAGARRPFTTRTLSALSRLGYQVVGRNSEYALTRPLPDGRILRIERDFSPVAVKPEERAYWEGIQARLSEVVPRGALEATAIPATKPPFRGIVVDSEGRIWVSRYTEAELIRVPPRNSGEGETEHWVEPSLWDVIDPRGTFLGSVITPPRSRFIDARGSSIWVLERGELDEEYVVRLTIVPTNGQVPKAGASSVSGVNRQ